MQSSVRRYRNRRHPAVRTLGQHLRVSYDENGRRHPNFLWLFSSGNPTQQKEAKNRPSDDSKNLRLYLDQ